MFSHACVITQVPPLILTRTTGMKSHDGCFPLAMCNKGKEEEERVFLPSFVTPQVIMVVNLGGFVPRRFNQFSKDPAWMIAAFALGYWPAEYIFLLHKLRAGSYVHDPHRYVYQPKNEH